MPTETEKEEIGKKDWIHLCPKKKQKNHKWTLTNVNGRIFWPFDQ